jgi:K+-sensing histidine kinase KdpD
VKNFKNMPGNKFPARQRFREYGFALLLVFLTIALAFLLQRLMPHASLLLLFLTCVLLIASRTGLGPSLFASLLSFLAINFFFTQPFLTLRVEDDSDFTTLLFFLLIATITGNLAARMQREIAERKASLRRISEVYEFSRKMSSSSTTEAVLQELVTHIARLLDTSVRVIHPLEPWKSETAAKTSGYSNRVLKIWISGNYAQSSTPGLKHDGGETGMCFSSNRHKRPQD